MLHKGTVERVTFELLIQLMQDEKLKNSILQEERHWHCIWGTGKVLI